VAAGLTFEQALPAAAERLAALKEAGRFASFGDVAVAYRISGGEEPVAYGVFCLVDTAEISSSAEEPGKVIRNEDVFIEKVKQRNELNQRLRHLLSPVLLLAWVPVIGDVLCVAAGWFRINWISAMLFMAVGKFARYWAIAAAISL